jgi:hypothetical protein
MAGCSSTCTSHYQKATWSVNATYALVNPRIKEPRYGVIINGSHSTQGPVMVRLDGQKDARAMTPKLFDVIK